MAKASGRQATTVSRRIYFYRIDVGSTRGGRPRPFNGGSAFDHLAGLSHDEEGLYMPGPDNTFLSAWVDSGGNYPRLRLGTIRRGGFPQVEDAGRISGLNLSENQGLVEMTHVVSFPHNILGAVFNFYGPRATRLGHYLGRKVPEVPVDSSVHPLVRGDVLRQLDRFDSIRLFQLKIRPSYVETIKRADESLGKAFEAAQAAGQGQGIEITLRCNRKKESRLTDSLLSVAKELISPQRTDVEHVREGADKFIVNGRPSPGSRVEELDLLSDKFVSDQQIIRARGRTGALQTESAYNAIISAYEDMRGELESAADVRI